MTLSLAVPGIREGLAIIANSDSKLILLVGSEATVLREAVITGAALMEARVLELNLVLARALASFGQHERPDVAWDILEDVLGDRTAPLALASTDILFELTLRFRPYEALRRLGRRAMLLAPWFGTVDGGMLTRAQPGHPEFHRVKVDVPYIIVPAGKGVGG